MGLGAAAVDGSSAERTSPSVRLVLIGPMAAGKTTIGRRVARILEVPFVDTDRRIASVHGPIPQIFQDHGEEQFRRWEHEAVRDALAQDGVIALGGGAVTHPETRDLLRAQAVIFLTVNPQTVASRLGGGGRPLLAGDEDPVQRWTTIFEERQPWYEDVASFTIDTSRLPMFRVAEDIARWWRQYAADTPAETGKQESDE